MKCTPNWRDYTYDSWGKLISTTGSLASTVGVTNPYRYRGYRYDTETGLYYLQSRYYNPDWGRFINADGLIGRTGELLGHNLFAYCGNNPVNMHDPSGLLFDATIDWFKNIGKSIANFFASIYDVIHDSNTKEVLDGVSKANDGYEIVEFAKDGLDDPIIHTRNVLAVGTEDKPKISKLKISKLTDDLPSYINRCKDAYERMEIFSQTGGVNIIGRTWNDLSAQEKIDLPQQMAGWDPQSILLLEGAIGKKGTSMGRGIVYGLP